jgi:hypothetical protein
LVYEDGRDERLLRQLFGLLTLTRRRHRLPPQPVEWFRNLVDGFGADLSIRIASKDGRPAAGILTLRSKNKLVYKYGGSDAGLNHLGGMALLFWRAIQDAKRDGAEEFDLGRTDCDNPGLIAFKEHWAAARGPLTYWRCQTAGKPAAVGAWKTPLAQRIFAWLPEGLLVRAGRLLYRHIG